MILLRFLWGRAAGIFHPGMAGAMTPWEKIKRTFTAVWIWPVPKERRFWPLWTGWFLPPGEAPAMATISVWPTQAVQKPSMPISNISMFARAKSSRQGRSWGQQGRLAGPPDHICILSCCTGPFAMIHRSSLGWRNPYEKGRSFSAPVEGGTCCFS